MFERFTDKGRAVVVRAQDAARGFNHEAIDFRHLLLGLVRVDGIASVALVSVGVRDQDIVRALLEEMPRRDVKPEGHIPFTPAAKTLLERALKESLHLGHNYVGPEHVLLAALGHPQASFLSSFASPEEIRQRVYDNLPKSPQRASEKESATLLGLEAAVRTRLQLLSRQHMSDDLLQPFIDTLDDIRR